MSCYNCFQGIFALDIVLGLLLKKVLYNVVISNK